LLVKGRKYAVVAGAKVQARVGRQEKLKDCTYIHGTEGIVFRPQSIHVMKFCNPGTYQIGIFAEPGGSGDCKLLRIGSYKTADSLSINGKPPLSVRIGRFVTMLSCTEENMQGDCVASTGKQTLERPGGIKSLTASLTQLY